MSITNSIIVEDRIQCDGRRAVREQHTDQLGILHFVDYLAEADANINTTMLSRAAQIDADLAFSETTDNILRAYNQVSPIFNYSTATQFRAALRLVYKDATDWNVVRLGKFINGLNLSNAQLTAVFGVSGAQLTALKNKLIALAAKYDDVIAQIGD